MSDFENEETEEIEFEVLEKIQLFHQDFDLVLEYTFGKIDFIATDEKDHFLLSIETARKIVSEIKKEYGVKLNVDTTVDTHLDLLVFLDSFLGEKVSLLDPKLAANIFVLESFDELDQDIGGWNRLSFAAIYAQQLQNEENSDFESEDDEDDETSAEGTDFFDELVVKQIANMMERGKTSKEVLEEFMNHIIMDMLESKEELSNEEAFEKFLEIAQKRDDSGIKSVSSQAKEKDSDDEPDPQ